MIPAEILFIQLKVLDVIDIFLAASLLYTLYYLLRGTAAINIFLGIVTIFLIWRIVTVLQMVLLGEILGAFVSVGFIALIIIFQPEIRQFLLALGTPKFIIKYRNRFSFLSRRQNNIQHYDWEQTITKTCFSLGSKNTGALIVITRQHNLFEYLQTGVRVDAMLSQALIENIFFKNSPLHDGAVIISGERVKAAGCILPVTKKLDLPGRPGLRHRAALGVAEQSDAIAIVVSEETGHVSVAHEGHLESMATPDDLLQLLESLKLAEK